MNTAASSDLSRHDVGSEFGKTPLRYNFEYERRLRACFIGAGGHSFRNVYPCLQYAPVDLVAVCDLDRTRAETYARQFGALRAYTDHQQMLERERPEVVFIVTFVDTDGRIQATDLTKDCLDRGCHVWSEKPLVASLREVEELMIASRGADRHVMTGIKKVFFPSIVRANEISADPAFGRPSALYLRYPQAIPPFEHRGDPKAMASLLDHIYHPAAIANFLMGPIAHASYEWEPRTGGAVTTIAFASGAIGTMHFTAGQSAAGPLERLEVIGEGEHVVVENGVKLTYYRRVRAAMPGYGRNPSYLVDNADAPLYFEPEFSLGQLGNKNLFYLGYVAEILHFCEAILAGEGPTKGTLADVAEIMRLYEFYCTTPPGVRAPLPGFPPATADR